MNNFFELGPKPFQTLTSDNWRNVIKSALWSIIKCSIIDKNHYCTFFLTENKTHSHDPVGVDAICKCISL